MSPLLLPPPPASLPVWKRLALHARRMLVNGILILLPVALSIVVIQFLFNLLGVFINPVVKYIPIDENVFIRKMLPYIVFAFLIYLTGLVGRRVIGRKLIGLVDAIFMNIPGIKIVYLAAKQLTESLSSTGTKDSFQSVVIIDCFFPDFKTVGFLTGSVRDKKGNLFYKVFLPTAPNPTSGYLLIVPEAKVHISDMDVQEAIQLIVSGGLVSSAVMDLPHTEAPSTPPPVLPIVKPPSPSAP